jgi:hypothetical protein
MAYEQDLESFAIGIGPKAPVRLRLDRANRHGLIAGATGTGKTITLQTMAESFSRAGVPVFVTDVKGDLSGIAAPGAAKPKLMERFQRMAEDDAQLSSRRLSRHALSRGFCFPSHHRIASRHQTTTTTKQHDEVDIRMMTDSPGAADDTNARPNRGHRTIEDGSGRR